MKRYFRGCAALVLLPSLALADPLPGGTLDPTTIPKYQVPLLIPPAMPRTDKINLKRGKNIDYYEIAQREFYQQILPPTLPPTKVWGYGSLEPGAIFNAPSLTIEAKWNTPVRVRWINELVDQDGHYLPHLLPVDQTLHWANPPGECRHGSPRTDCSGMSPEPYLGPVPMTVHVHGAETTEWSDGYPEAWFLPDANDIPQGYFTRGSFYDLFKGQASTSEGLEWATGEAVFQYPNEQRATTLWYHDHSLGLTRQNVYAGPAGFYVLRGGPDDEVQGRLPGPAPALGDAPGTRYYEIPIVIQDRSFNEDGSLFYPDNRAFFEGLEPEQLQIPFIPGYTVGEEMSDVAPIWNPEFFGNTMMVNGSTWPYLDVEQRRYRFRLLNGCNSRFLIVRMDNGTPFWQIGAEGGFLPEPVMLDELLIGPAERADVIVDFSDVPVGTTITMINLGPDEPFGGGEPGADFDAAHPDTTGQVMQFYVGKRKGADKSTPPAELVLPPITPLGDATVTRRLSLNEEESATVFVTEQDDGDIVEVSAEFPGAAPFGPTAALLGTLDESGNPVGYMWSDIITENPEVGGTEVWEIYNFTADAHPIHIHLVQFQVLDRQGLVTDEEGMATAPAMLSGAPRPPEVWESGFKDTVIAYPGEVTRLKARFDLAGLFVWHCHILEHEDNEMMRPYCVGTSAACDLANSKAGHH